MTEPLTTIGPVLEAWWRVWSDEEASMLSEAERPPVGRNVVLLCDGISCRVMGCEGVRKRLERTLGVALGDTTADDRFTLLPTACLGACDHAPAIMIGGELFGDLDAHKLDVIIDWYKQE